MADGTKIEWSEATWNIVTGCSVVSPGCTNCYAMRLAGTRLKHHPSREGLTAMSPAGPVWNGTVRFNRQWLTQPVKWTRPRRIFVCAHGDLFHDEVPDAWLIEVFAMMRLAHWHTFQILTKRSKRIPDLLATPAAVRWVSAEPLLGLIDLWGRPLTEYDQEDSILPWIDRLDWVVAGGESGLHSRPMHPEWARYLRDQCAAAGVPFLFKQHGSWMQVYDRDLEDPDWRRAGEIQRLHPRGRWLNLAGGHGFHGDRVIFVVPTDKRVAGRHLDGVTHDEYPLAQGELIKKELTHEGI